MYAKYFSDDIKKRTNIALGEDNDVFYIYLCNQCRKHLKIMERYNPKINVVSAMRSSIDYKYCICNEKNDLYDIDNEHTEECRNKEYLCAKICIDCKRTLSLRQIEALDKYYYMLAENRQLSLIIDKFESIIKILKRMDEKIDNAFKNMFVITH